MNAEAEWRRKTIGDLVEKYGEAGEAVQAEVAARIAAMFGADAGLS